MTASVLGLGPPGLPGILPKTSFFGVPIYLEHIPLIFENLTTFLKSAQQEKRETVVKQEKGKSHGP